MRADILTGVAVIGARLHFSRRDIMAMPASEFLFYLDLLRRDASG